MKTLLIEIIFDLVTELHFILKTTLPDPWIFILLRSNKDLSIILNNITYFTVYITFLVWFAKVFIARARAQVSSGKSLQAKDKFFLVVSNLLANSLSINNN